MFRISFYRLAVLAALTACSDPNAPPYRLPDPDPSLDPASIRIGLVLYRCDEWIQPKPAAERVVVDVFFGRRTDQDPADRPLPEHLGLIRAEGGSPLFSFNFPAVRALVPTSSIPSLHDRWPFLSVHTVPDERRYDWRATSAYDQPISEPDLERISVLGGRVLEHLEALNMLVIQLPNSSFPALRSSTNVLFAEASGQFCAAG